MGNSQPLPHIKEQQESSPFNQAPSDIGTQVRFAYLQLLTGCLCLHSVHRPKGRHAWPVCEGLQAL